MGTNSGKMNHGRRTSEMVSLCVCVISIVIMTTCVVDAQEIKRSEYEVKAAFVYNFLKFVEWPDKAFTRTPLTINLCVVGEYYFGNAMKNFQGDTVRGKTITIRQPESLQDIKTCQVIFISRSEKVRLPQILKAIRGMHILTIGDTDIFERQGVIINFSIIRNKVRFEIDVNAARRAGIRISSKLLHLARAVHE